MKSKRAKEFIRNSAFSAIQLPGEVMYSIHMNVEGKLLDRKSAERAVELAEQDAEEKIEALKARAVEAYCEQCGWYEADGNCSINEDKCPKGCEYANQFIRKLNER